jgi:hypothetical protein
MLERERELRRSAEEAFDLVAPFVAKFAAAAPHYSGGQPRYRGSLTTLDPDPSYVPALTASCTAPGCPPNGPTLGDLRLLADAYTIASAMRNTSTKDTPND